MLGARLDMMEFFNDNTTLVIVLVALGAVFALLKAGVRSNRRPHHFYKSRTSLLTNPELRAFKYLTSAIGEDAHVCPKVRVADILQVDRKKVSNRYYLAAFNSIAMKHVDFVVTSLDGEFLFALEVDDSSHNKPKAKARDQLINSAFEQADIELVRVGVRNFEKSEALRSAIDIIKLRREFVE